MKKALSSRAEGKAKRSAHQELVVGSKKIRDMDDNHILSSRSSVEQSKYREKGQREMKEKHNRKEEDRLSERGD